MGQTKIVDFGNYCPTCKHCKLDESEYPCDVCLGIPARPYTDAPEKYEKGDRNEKINKTRFIHRLFGR